MPIVKCKICKNTFYSKPSHIQKGWGKYCSILCKSKGNQSGKLVMCNNCGKKIYRSKANLKKSSNQMFFCSKSCHCIWENKNNRIGINSPNWKFGQNVYRKILDRNNIKPICIRCGIDDIRVLEIHHKNKNRCDNTVKNLIWLCRNCHALEHRKLNS